MKTAASVPILQAHLVDLGCHIEETLGPEVEAPPSAGAKGYAQNFRERTNAPNTVGCCLVEVSASTLAAKAVVVGDRFEEGRLARTIFTHKKADPRSNLQALQALDRGYDERIDTPVLNPISEKRDRPQPHHGGHHTAFGWAGQKVQRRILLMEWFWPTCNR